MSAVPRIVIAILATTFAATPLGAQDLPRWVQFTVTDAGASRAVRGRLERFTRDTLYVTIEATDTVGAIPRTMVQSLQHLRSAIPPDRWSVLGCLILGGGLFAFLRVGNTENDEGWTEVISAIAGLAGCFLGYRFGDAIGRTSDTIWLPLTLHDADAAPSAPANDSFTIVSRALGEIRRINVHTPEGHEEQRRTRFPVLYMPDGGVDGQFADVTRAVDSLVAVGVIRPPIVVGIANTERHRDLTGPTRVAADSAMAPRVGGSEAFRRFIVEELMPEIRNRYRTTTERAIMGETLAGLFIVETFLVEPGLFDHYIAIDPSVWWNGGALVDSAPPRLASLDGRKRTLYLATSNVPEIASGTARLAEMVRSAAPRGLTRTYAARPDFTSATIFRAVGPSALAVAFRPDPTPEPRCQLQPLMKMGSLCRPRPWKG